MNPDPEEVLATHLCSRRPTATGEGGGTESFYCDPQYEKLYQQQLKELDRPKRADIIKQMQERLYTDAPVIALYYPNNLEGYRKDRIASITPIPEDKGILYGGSGYWPFYTLRGGDQRRRRDGRRRIERRRDRVASRGGVGVTGHRRVRRSLRRRQGAADEREMTGTTAGRAGRPSRSWRRAAPATVCCATRRPRRAGPCSASRW